MDRYSSGLRGSAGIRVERISLREFESHSIRKIHGDRGVTVNTTGCGPVNGGSIPLGHPNIDR